MEQPGYDTPNKVLGATASPYHILPKTDPRSHGYINQQRRLWTLMHASYEARNIDSEKQLQAARSDPNANIRVAAHNTLVDTLKTTSLTDAEKVYAINNWVNEAIHYDTTKVAAPNYDWHQTNIQTLTSGQGQCSDIARLKYEMLKKVGVDESKMRLVDGVVYDGDGKKIGAHEVLLVNEGGKNVILNDEMFDEGSMARIRFADEFMLDPSSIFVPLLSQNGKNVSFYPTKETQDGCFILQTSGLPPINHTQRYDHIGSDTDSPERRKEIDAIWQLVDGGVELNAWRREEIPYSPQSDSPAEATAESPACPVHFQISRRATHHRSAVGATIATAETAANQRPDATPVSNNPPAPATQESGAQRSTPKNFPVAPVSGP